MKIKKELIPSDKLEEITVKQIYNIIDYLFEPLKVDIEDIELPKYLPSLNLNELENRTFIGKLLSIKDGKALFEPKQGENNKIQYYDEVLEIRDLLFELKHKQKEAQKVENRAIRKEVFGLFDSLFSRKADSHQHLQTKQEIFREKLQNEGFLKLEPINKLAPISQEKLINVICDKSMAYGIAMFDYLGFCAFLDKEKGTKYKANHFLSKLYNENAKDGTQARHYRTSLTKNNKRYTSYLHKEQVAKDYQELK